MLNPPLGTFSLAATANVPDMTIDHVFAGARPDDTRYEQCWGRNGCLDVAIKVPPDGDMGRLIEVVTEALERAGFSPEF